MLTEMQIQLPTFKVCEQFVKFKRLSNEVATNLLSQFTFFRLLKNS